jgi:hypothetical protein
MVAHRALAVQLVEGEALTLARAGLLVEGLEGEVGSASALEGEMGWRSGLER